MTDNIRWNKKKHEQVLNKAQLAEREKVKHRALLLMERMYKTWKHKFCQGTKTKAQIVEGLYQLQSQIGEAAAKEPELKEWREFTLNIIEDEITKVIATIQATENSIKEYVPSFSKAMPHEAKFDSEEGFLNIPFIKAITEKEGFIGFLREYPKMYAFYDDGECPEIGTVKTEIGINRFPTMQAFQAMMEKGNDFNAKLMVGSTQPAPSADTDPTYPPAPPYDAGADSAKSTTPSPDATPDASLDSGRRFKCPPKRYGGGNGSHPAKP